MSAPVSTVSTVSTLKLTAGAASAFAASRPRAVPDSVARTVFAVPDARHCLFASKEDYIVFKAAWKVLANSGIPMSSSLYAAQAIVTGRDLHRTFSANRRPHQAAEPFKALLIALESLGHPLNQRISWKALDAKLSPTDAATLHGAVRIACSVARNLSFRANGDRKAIACGEGTFKIWGPLPAVGFVEGDEACALASKKAAASPTR